MRALLLVAVLLGGCASTPRPIGRCPDMSDEALALLADTQRALDDDAYLPRLISMSKGREDDLTRVVALVVSQAQRQVVQSGDARAAVRIRHGADWLSRHPAH